LNFYRRAGFELASEPFEEAGIEHRIMRRALVTG
jgi:predicted GNAT family N-acyltransferase